MWGAIIGAATGLVGSLVGSAQSAKSNSRVRKRIEKQQAANEAWYQRRYNEDATQRADAQRVLTMAGETVKNRNKSSSGTRAVMGGTEASVQADKAANAQALSSAASSIAAAGEARKDQVEDRYLTQRADLENQLNGLDTQQAQNNIAAAQGVAQTAGTLGTALDEWLGKKDDNTATGGTSNA